jgi:Transposase DDE domain group 1
MANAQCGTIRTKLFKIGARVTLSVRRVVVSMSESYPFQDLFARVWSNLRALRVALPAALPSG